MDRLPLHSSWGEDASADASLWKECNRLVDFLRVIETDVAQPGRIAHSSWF
jgi:hypothetical protein